MSATPTGTGVGSDAPVEEVSAGGIVVHRPTTQDPPLFLVIRDSYRNWGFPKGHLEPGEDASAAALREVAEETGLTHLQLTAPLPTIEWRFRFRGRHIHKTCHFFLIESAGTTTCPQHEEGITACRWEVFDRAIELVAYANAREVLRTAREVLAATSDG